MKQRISRIIRSRISYDQLLKSLAVFALLFLTSKMGQYIYFHWETSPAILWPPTGIALAILYLGGYRYIFPIFLGLLATSITGPYGHLLPAVFTTPMGQVLGTTAGAFLLKRFRFDDRFPNVKNILVFLSVITVSSMVAPTVTTTISLLTGNLTTAAYISWSRAWAGYVFSSLILFPLIVAWSQAKPEPRLVVRSTFESVSVTLLLVASVYFLFWTRFASQYSFVFFALFFFSHFWVCLRYSIKAVTLSVFGTTIIGIFGLFISPSPTKELNEQLFGTELFLFLIVPIFYAFSALVRERATTILELREAMSGVERENVLKNEFIAVLAHELRNPLAPVKSTLEILQLQKNLDGETQSLIKSANQQLHAMRRLLDDLLDITRVTQKKFYLQLEWTALSSLIDRSVGSTRPFIEERKHTIVINQKGNDALWLNVDPVRFEQILVNLLNNAVKYTDPGGRIEIFSEVKRDGSLELRVKDTGIGIEKDHLEDIFESFWQVRSSPPRTSWGSIGVGLALTKHIVNLHGGTIHAESGGKGKGSTLFVRMPPLMVMEGPPASEPSSLPSLPHASLPSSRIVVVDDNEAAADSLAKLLTLKGYVVETAYSGGEAFEIVKTFGPDIVLLDISLPDMTGFEVAKKLRATGFTNKIIALSGYGQREEKEKAFEAGFDHHFTKPMSVAVFEEYLRGLHRGNNTSS